MLIISFGRTLVSENNLYAKINGEESSAGEVTCGVRRGSVLGPILFLVHTNDLYQAVGQDVARLFADDTGVFTHNKNCNALIAESKNCAKII